MAFGVALGGYIWDFFGEEATVFGLHFTSPAFSINGLIYLVSLAVFAWGLKDVNGGAHTPEEMSEYKKWSHYRVILRSRRVWLLVPAWLAINSIIGMWFNFSIRVLTDKERSLPFAGQFLMGHWSGTERDVYVGFGVFLVIFASGVLAWSFILGRYRKTSVMLVATGGLAVILPAIYLMNHHHSFSGATFYLLVAMLAIAVLVMSGFAPAALTYLADVTEAHAEDRGSIMGLYSVFLGVGQFIGTATGGLFANWKGIDGLLLLSAIFGTITTLTLISLHRRNSLATA
jgi:MFS family permease